MRVSRSAATSSAHSAPSRSSDCMSKPRIAVSRPSRSTALALIRHWRSTSFTKTTRSHPSAPRFLSPTGSHSSRARSIRLTDLPHTTAPNSVSAHFTSATAPGLTSQPGFGHYHFALRTNPVAILSPRTDDQDENHTGPLMKPYVTVHLQQQRGIPLVLRARKFSLIVPAVC